MKLNAARSPRGFAALITAIVFSTILTALVFGESASAFWSRYDQLDMQNSMRARALADSCAYEALLEYKEEVSSETPQTISLSSADTCVIDTLSFSNTDDMLTISTHAIVTDAYAQTTLTAQKNFSGTLAITNWSD